MADDRAPERAAAVDEHLAARRWRVARHRVQRDGEGVAEDRHLVGHALGDGDEHRLVGGQVVGEATGRVLRRPGVDAGRDGALREVPAHAEVAGLARGARWVDAAGPAREPGVQDDALADLDGGDRGADLDDVGHHLVPEHRREGEVPVQRAVAEVVAEVHEDHLGVGAADAGQPRLGDAPVVPERRRAVELLEAHRGPGEPDHEGVGLVRWRPAVAADAVEQTLHSYAPRF